MAARLSSGVRGNPPGPGELSLCLQAGGASSRMGSDKALKPFCGEALIERVLRRMLSGELSGLIAEIVVTTNQPDMYQFLIETNRPRLRLVKDVMAGKGALGGLYTALMSSHSQITAVVACDLPFADGGLLATGYRLLSEQGWDGFVPHTRAGLEPLHALYRTQPCLPFVEKALAAGEQKVSGWFTQANICEYDVEEKQPSPFFNVNTPAQFEQAEQWARSYDGISNRG